MTLYFVLILNMPLVFCHSNGNLAKKINQVRKEIQKFFSKQKPIRGLVAGNQKEDCAALEIH